MSDSTPVAGWSEFETALRRALDVLGLPIAADDRRRMFDHYVRVVETNRQFNLTRITSPATAAVKHYADSLTLLATPWVAADRPLTVLDVGTGAGFPAVPLAIVCPVWSVTAIDGTGKKARFVAESAAVLGLTNLTAVHARAADLARQGGSRFDVILVRAVSRIDRLLPEIAPLLRTAGAIVFYKTDRIDAEEEAAAARVAARLGLAHDAHAVDLPLAAETLRRQLLRYRR